MISAQVQTLIRNRLPQIIEKQLKVVFQIVPAEEQHRSQAVLSLLERLLACRLEEVDSSEPHNPSQRQAILEGLKKFISGFLPDMRIIHHCPMGCHASKEAAIRDLGSMLSELFLNHAPPVPTGWNKWTKVWPPVVWVSVLLNLGNVFKMPPA